jgi:hypothetical protein
MATNSWRVAKLMIRLGDFTLRGGGWRFGARVVTHEIVDRLLTAGIAVRDGDTVRLAAKEAA